MDNGEERIAALDKNSSRESMRLQISKVSEVADIGTCLSEAISTDHLLSLILKQTLDLMNAEVCIIWLRDTEGSFIPRISFGLKGPIIQSVKIRSSSKIVKCMIKKRELVNIYDMLKDKRIPLKNLIKKEGLRSLLAAPLIAEDESIGFLMVCTKYKRHFNDVDLKVFNALAKQSSLAITNIGLYEQMDKRVKEKAKEISLLFTMSRSISSAVDIDLLLNVILEKTRMLMKARFCTLRLLDRSRRRLLNTSFAGLSKSGASALSKFENNVFKKIYKTGATYVVNDMNTYLKKVPAYIKKNKIGSLLVVSLAGKRRRIGMLSVYIQEVRLFEKDEIEMLEMVADLCSMAIDNAAMLERIRRDYLNTIKTLAKIIDANDSYTRGHCDKVMKYSLAICKKLGLPQRQTAIVKIASLLHDIGKIGIDLNILRKKGKLTEKDWKKIKMHSNIGAAIISQTGFLGEIAPVVRHHHSHFNGGGYPDCGKHDGHIPIGSRIIAVADAYDAMTSDRPYRRAMSKHDAMKELRRCTGQQFDPKIVDAFLLNMKS